MNVQHINRVLHSRGAFSCALVLMCVSALVSLLMSPASVPSGVEPESLLRMPERWIANRGLSMAVALIVVIFSAIVGATITRSANPFRYSSWLGSTIFAVMMAAQPDQLTRFNSGVFVLAVVMAATSLMISTFRNPQMTRRVFLVFFMLTVASLAQSSLIFYLPIFLIALFQMHVFSWRTLSAALLGVITPLWLIVGFGIRQISDIEFVHHFALYAYTPEEMLPFVALMVVTAIAAILFPLLNFMKMIAYNARIRAINGFLSLLLGATFIYGLVDYRNINVYWPLLMWLTAYQAGHFFASKSDPRTCCPALALIALFISITVWQIID